VKKSNRNKVITRVSSKCYCRDEEKIILNASKKDEEQKCEKDEKIRTREKYE